MKVGDKVTIMLGRHRGTWYDCDSLPSNMLADGTVTTIRKIPSYNSWIILNGCVYHYPRELLLLENTKKCKLLNNIKEFV